MTELATISLALALAVAAFSALVSLFGSRASAPDLLKSARNGVVAVFALLTLASGILMYALAAHDFRLAYVASYSSRDMSPLYLIASFYAGNEGSLLFWSWLLSLFALVAVLQCRRRHVALLPVMIGVLMSVQTFFNLLVFFVANPFQVLPVAPPDGRGLNPLLENPGMIVHPPALLAGYVSFAVPFALAMAALATGQVRGDWLRTVRVWVLISWVLLGVGNLLGAQWAYVELGWGGYWAWDPVENAGLMPWLTGAALLHSSVSERSRGMFRVWNLALIIATFNLTVFGTFITRSGFLSSVHTYKESGLTVFFLVFLALSVVAPALLLARRRGGLRDLAAFDSWVSREGGFLMSSVVFVVAAFAVLLGTVFPTFYGWTTGATVNVTGSFFNQVVNPLFVVILVLMGLCPFLVGRGGLSRVVRSAMVPIAVAVAVAAVLVALRLGTWYAVVVFSVSAFVMSAVVVEWSRALRARAKARRRGAAGTFFTMLWENRPRFGGYIVHLGVALVAIGVMGSSAFQIDKETTLKLGQAATIGRYTVTYEGLSEQRVGRQDIVGARVYVMSGDQVLDRMNPQKIFHPSYEQSVTEVAIRSTPVEDLYIILAGWDRDGTATLRLVVNPLVMWLWIGGGVFLLGSIIALWPGSRRLPDSGEEAA